MPTFGSVLTAMVTPFAPDGSLDLDGAQALARWLVQHGNDGVVVAGTTGESATLTHDEQIALIEAVREAIPTAIVVAGAGSNDTSAAVELTERATEAGANGILSVTPYYNRPSQRGIEEHFRAVAHSTDLPVLLYDIPVRTGRKIAESTLLRLFEIDNVLGTKDAAKDPAATASLIARAPERIEVYSGDDSLTLAFLAVGAVGVIGVATHWCAPEMAAMVAAYRAGQVTDAIRLNALMIPSFDYEGSDDAPNPVPSKALMNLIGVKVGGCRPPMGFEPDDLDDRARTVLAGLGRSL